MQIEIKGSMLKNVLFFEKMLTPKIITFIYWMALLGCVIGAIGVMNMSSRHGFGGPIPGLLILIGGPFIVRIWCELFIVMFKVNDHLRDLRDDARSQGH